MSRDVVDVLRACERELRYEVFAGAAGYQRAFEEAADLITRLREANGVLRAEVERLRSMETSTTSSVCMNRSDV